MPQFHWNITRRQHLNVRDAWITSDRQSELENCQIRLTLDQSDLPTQPLGQLLAARQTKANGVVFHQLHVLSLVQFQERLEQEVLSLPINTHTRINDLDF